MNMTPTKAITIIIGAAMLASLADTFNFIGRDLAKRECDRLTFSSAPRDLRAAACNRAAHLSGHYEGV